MVPHKQTGTIIRVIFPSGTRLTCPKVRVSMSRVGASPRSQRGKTRRYSACLYYDISVTTTAVQQAFRDCQCSIEEVPESDLTAVPI